MSQYADDILAGVFAGEEQKQRRLAELTAWASMFAEDQMKLFGKQIDIDPKMVSRLNSTYWDTVEACIRPYMLPHDGSDKRVIDRHKIASALELCICAVQPIDVPDPEEKNELNARFAYYVGLNLISNWTPDKFATLFVSDSFNREHLAWLGQIHANEDFQIFSNAATWYLVELICMERSSRKAVLG